MIITGSCQKCKRLMQTIDFDPRTDETPALICSTCYDKYYSL